MFIRLVLSVLLALSLPIALAAEDDSWMQLGIVVIQRTNAEMRSMG
jgi:hypothetical protein